MSKKRDKIKKYRDRLRLRAKEKLTQQMKAYGKKVKISAPTDGVKMSEVIGEFIEPYMDDIKTIDAYRNLIAIASIAWNMSLLPQKQQIEQWDKILETLPNPTRLDGKRIIEKMLERKLKHFSQYKRMIINYTVEEHFGYWNLSVASTPEAVVSE